MAVLAVLTVICPACGALMMADDMDGLYEDALLHTRDAHRYEIPREHVVAAAVSEQF